MSFELVDKKDIIEREQGYHKRCENMSAKQIKTMLVSCKNASAIRQDNIRQRRITAQIQLKKVFLKQEQVIED